jgi:hypothetical protein
MIQKQRIDIGQNSHDLNVFIGVAYYQGKDIVF